MKNIRWVLSGFLLGLVLAIAPSCGPTGSDKCGPRNCQGCCTADNRCDPGNVSTSCGFNGGLCAPCLGNSICQGGICTNISGPSKDGGTNNQNDAGMNMNDGGTCSGCLRNGQCITTIDNLNCGANGGLCDTCTGSETCNVAQGVCQDPSCNGCVSSSGCIALSSQSNSQCGANGAACVACGANQTCVNGVCQNNQTGCNSTNCANGCCTSTGTCVPGTTNTSCGAGGNFCTSCAGGQTCTATTGGGQCQTTMTAGTYGSACTTASNCSGIGAGAICRTQTSSGNATYQGGYCTKTCASSTDCGSTAFCLNLGVYGESAICAASCSASNPCRTPGYACYDLGNGQGACWISPTPAPDAGPAAPANLIGSACSSNATCQASGSFPAGECITSTTADGGASGFTSGYCTAECSASPTLCGSTGLCINFTNFSLCTDLCTSGGAGQSNCRPGYVCEQYGFADGGTSTDGFCWPSCNAAGWGCPSGQTCNTLGYCQ